MMRVRSPTKPAQSLRKRLGRAHRVATENMENLSAADSDPRPTRRAVDGAKIRDKFGRVNRPVEKNLGNRWRRFGSLNPG
jgi:hypothetical protein